MADRDTATPAVTGSGLLTTRSMLPRFISARGRRALRLRRSCDVCGLVVEHIRGEVGTVGPGDRSEFGIDTGLGEELLISEGLEDGPNRAFELGAEVEFAHDAVGEGQSEAVPAEVLDGPDVV